MNRQYFGEGFKPSEVVVESDKDTESLVENSDSFDDEVTEHAIPILETPVDETEAADSPNWPLDNEPSKNEAPVQETPVDETVAYITPVRELNADESEVKESIPYKTPTVETDTHEALTGTNAVSSGSLLNSEEAEHFRTRWNEIQGKFVDDPRNAVQQADGLVSEVVEQITQMFVTEHSSLEGQWNQGNDVSTEDLRKALQKYRSFFNRLVV
jgi:hypothetical protein